MWGRSTKIEGVCVCSPLTVNAKVLHKDTELISNVCIYVFNFTVARSWRGLGGGEYFHIQVM